jgi:hypothetical protein
MMPPDILQVRPHFLEYRPIMPLTLGEKQNIADQPPFDRMAQEIQLPDDFFTGDPMAGLGAFVRCVALEKQNWAEVWWNTAPLKHLKPHVHPWHINTSVETHHRRAAAFIDSFKYLMQYLHEYWITGGPVYDTQGYPKPPHVNTKIHVPRFTFAAYQAKKRGDPMTGLENELPGLETAESLRAAVGQGKHRVNRTFRVYQTLKE